jgi:hypothetical protein
MKGKPNRQIRDEVRRFYHSATMGQWEARVDQAAAELGELRHDWEFRQWEKVIEESMPPPWAYWSECGPDYEMVGLDGEETEE